VAGEHQEILRLALAGDADGAARALHAHIASFVERAFPEAGTAAQEEGGQA
jgi:DNA-binding GntR family transcriptional regulator